MHHRFSWLVLSVLLLPLCTLHADFLLVREGRAEAVIVLDVQATRSAQLGALELQHHVKLMTGAELVILRQDQPPAKGNFIKIGGENGEMIGEDNKILFQGRKLLLTGNDSRIFSPVDYQKAETFPAMELECKGSLFAVYDFMNLYLDIHFYGMDDSGTTYPTMRTLSVKEKDRRFSPPMDAFRMVYDDDRDTTKFRIEGRRRALWQLRWRMTSLFGQTNHNIYSIYFKHWGKAKNPRLAKAFTEKHEDCFAKGFKGKFSGGDYILRVNYPWDPDLPPQLCYSNPDTVKFFADEVLTYFNGHNVIGGWKNRRGIYPPTRTLIPRFKGKPFFYPIEGGDGGDHCMCDNCKKMLALEDGTSLSNSKFKFISQVAREAAKTNPEAGVSTLAYFKCLDYPRKVELPDNLSVELCLTIYAWWHPIARDMQMSVYKEWVQKEAKRRPLTLWTYIYSPFHDARLHGNYKPFPGLYPWETAKLFKMFAKDGIRGWFTEVDMQYNQLEAYVAAMICYDPSLDAEQLIDKYFKNAFGQAGPAVKAFYREIEKAYWNEKNCPAAWLKKKNVVMGPKGIKHPYWTTGLHSPDFNWALGTTQRMTKLNGLIEQAKKLVKTTKEKARLNRIVEGIWNISLQGRREYEVLKARRNIPARTLCLKTVAPVKGELGKVPWEKGDKNGMWTTTYGLDKQFACEVTCVLDSDYLYVKLFDKRKPILNAQLWRENFECFIHDGDYPVYHIAISPNGVNEQLVHEFINDGKKIRKYDSKLHFNNIIGANDWELQMAIPRRSLPFRNNQLAINFMRSSAGGNAVWNPIFTSSYLDGMDSYGKLMVFPQKVESKQFRYIHTAKRQKDSAAEDGWAAVMPANKGWTVRYRFPKALVNRKYRITVAMRNDAVPEPKLRTILGVYDFKAKKNACSLYVPLEQSSGPSYKLFELPPCLMNEHCEVYIGGINKQLPNNKIYVDYMILELAD